MCLADKHTTLFRSIACVFAGAAFRDFLVETMDSIGYQPSYAGPDLWSYPAVKPDGFECYEYIVCYRDSVLYISQNPRKAIERLQDDSKLKEDKIEPPGVSLGATISKIKLDSGKYFWTMLPEQYVKSVVTNIEEDLARSGKRFPSKCVTPLSRNYAPWMVLIFPQ